MAAPNVLVSTNVNGKTAVQLVTTSATAIASCAGGSNKVLKVNALYISNVDGANNYTLTMDLYRSATAYRLGSQIIVPAASTLDVVSKSFYLEEGDALRLTASANNKLEAICSYEDIS
jgi:hypothetical protein